LNYKEILFFVAKCLTISLEEKNRLAIKKQLQLDSIDWDEVVKASTNHYVFPAFYCNLKRADFLHYLPPELVSYMEYITNLNRGRNKQIITQAKELNTLLLTNNITPIFLKGTGNLLAGIYDDIAERMVGDIDFLVSKEDYVQAIIVLKKFGYYKRVPFGESKRHYPRLIKKDSIAGVEIHKELLITKYQNEFNYKFIKKDIQVIRGVTVLSYANKLNLSIIANQINDNGFYYKTIALRNSYDVFLLSKKTIAKDAVNTLENLTLPLNCFLAACYEIFNNLHSLKYNNTKMAASYLKMFNNQFANPIPIIRHSKSYKIYKFTKKVFYVLYMSIQNKEYRFYLFKILTDKNWYNEKLVQLGFKK
jgi:hypothetical protein